MATVQSNISANQSNPSPIELADRAQRRLFVISVGFGVFAALIGALLAWLLWRANNTYQDTVRAEASARIAEAGDSAAKADERAAKADERASDANREAGRANERAGELEVQAQKLTQQNLELRSGVADLEREAADARAEQQRVQTELARQQERADIAERQLHETRRLVLPRSIPLNLRDRIIEQLRPFAGQVLFVREPAANDLETSQFAQQIEALVTAAGWRFVVVERVGAQVIVGNTERLSPPHGLLFFVPDTANPSPAAKAFMNGLKLSGVQYSLLLGTTDTGDPNFLGLTIGLKPIE